MICELRTLTFHESNFVTRGTELLSNSLFRNKLNNHNLNETIARSYWPWRYSKPWSNFCYHNIPPQLPQVATSGGAPPRPLKINDNIPPQLPPVLTSATGKEKYLLTNDSSLWIIKMSSAFFMTAYVFSSRREPIVTWQARFAENADKTSNIIFEAFEILSSHNPIQLYLNNFQEKFSVEA